MRRLAFAYLFLFLFALTPFAALASPPGPDLAPFFEEGIKPAFVHSIESKHFIIRHTDSDSVASNNISADAITPYLKDFDSYFEKYVKLFKKIDPLPPVKLTIDVWDFTTDVRFQFAVGFTTPSAASINLLPTIFKNPCLVRHTLAHELFHRVEFAYGLFRAGSDINESYWTEGLAEWATLFINPRDNAFLEFDAPNFFARPDVSIFELDYEAALFWIYLDERYRELHGKNQGGKVIAKILKAYDKVAPAALIDTVVPEIRRLVKEENKKSDKKGITGITPEAGFMQDFNLANFFAAIAKKSSRKQSYDVYERNPDDCGVKRSFPELTPDHNLAVESDNQSYLNTQKAPFGGAIYYHFFIGPNVTKLNLSVTTTNPNKVVLTALGFHGGDLKFSKTVGKGKGKQPQKLDLKFKPGTVPDIVVVVGGDFNETAQDFHYDDYTLKINNGGISGSWNFTTEKNTIEIRDLGNDIFEGSYRGAQFHERLQGTLQGKFENGNWHGVFYVTEDSVVVNGTFTLDYSNLNDFEELTGTITSHSNYNPVDKTFDIGFSRKRN